MPTSPPAFGELDLTHQGPSPLSPEQPDLGLGVAAPLVADERLPLCITLTLEGAHLARDPSRELMVVALPATTGRPRAAARGEAPDLTTADDPVARALLPARVTTWFNLDVAELCALPDEPGVYYVFAVLGDLQSNVCRVQWEGR